MDQEEEGFRVKDRRRFGEETGETKPSPSPDAEKPEPGGKAENEATGPSAEITFASFILGLSTQGLMCLGEIPDPQDGKKHQDLAAARQMIDILGLLRDKTKGNLGKSEEQLLEHILFDLRMKYVSLSKDK